MFSRKIMGVKYYHKVLKPVQISYKDLKQGIHPSLIEDSFSH